MLGLDGSENPADGYTSSKAFSIAMTKIRAAQEATEPVVFKIWLDDISDLDP